MAKIEPDSFTPRKFINMMKTTRTTEIGTRYRKRKGKAEVTWATPEDIETATVRV